MPSSLLRSPPLLNVMESMWHSAGNGNLALLRRIEMLHVDEADRPLESVMIQEVRSVELVRGGCVTGGGG